MRQAELTPTEWAVLRAIALYRFINVELLHRVVPATRGTIRNAAHKLYRFGLIGRTGRNRMDEADELPEIGVPHVFWLSVKGAGYMRRQGQGLALGSSRRLKGKKEIEHRLGIVAVHIAFRAWATATGKRNISFLTDFEPGSAKVEKVTSIPLPVPATAESGEKERVYVPDGYARFRFAAEGAPMYLMVLEFERGGENGDLSKFFGLVSTGRRTGKLSKIRQAAKLNLVELHKGIRRCPYLIVFGTDKARLHALKNWPDKAAEVWDRFFISSLPLLEAAGADFSRVWWRPNGEPRTLFSVEPGAAASSTSPPAPSQP